MLKDIGSLVNRACTLAVFAAMPLTACGGTADNSSPAQGDQAVSRPLTEQAQLLVDQGNLAQREGRYADALESFGQALEIHPDHPVPQFGTLMAAMAVGDTVLAAELREKLALTGPELLEMLGPGNSMGGMAPAAPHGPQGALPQGHPTIETPPDTLSSVT